MTLEEKLHKELDWLEIKHIDADGIIRNILSLCQQEIAEACKERDRRFQIYANAINQIDDFFEYRYRNYGGERTKEFVMDVIGGIIKKLNAPKESE